MDRQPPGPQTQEAFHRRLGVVIPLANEETTIEQFLQELLARLGPDDAVFCVLDNKSKDRTRELVERFGRERDARVIAVWAPENRCVVDAYFRGYREALAAGCRWILEMDGGFSHRPDQVPRFIDAMERGADFAAGSRFTSGGRYLGWGRRRLISQGGTFLTNLMLGTRMSDMTSGFECFTHRALRHVVDRGVRSRAHFFQTEIRFMLRDWSCVEVPITYSHPSAGCGWSSIREALSVLSGLRRELKA